MNSEKRTSVRALMSGTHSRSSPPDPHIVFAQVRTAARPCSLEKKNRVRTTLLQQRWSPTPQSDPGRSRPAVSHLHQQIRMTESSLCPPSPHPSCAVSGQNPILRKQRRDFRTRRPDDDTLEQQAGLRLLTSLLLMRAKFSLN